MGEELDQNNELRETCLRAFESFINRCPAEVDPFQDEIVAKMRIFATHDPNFDGDDEDDEDEDEEDEDDEVNDQHNAHTPLCN